MHCSDRLLRDALEPTQAKAATLGEYFSLAADRQIPLTPRQRRACDLYLAHVPYYEDLDDAFAATQVSHRASAKCRTRRHFAPPRVAASRVTATCVAPQKKRRGRREEKEPQ
jgi:hypothetical protein